VREVPTQCRSRLRIAVRLPLVELSDGGKFEVTAALALLSSEKDTDVESNVRTRAQAHTP